MQAFVIPGSQLQPRELGRRPYVKSFLLLKRYDGDVSQFLRSQAHTCSQDVIDFKAKLATFYSDVLQGLRRIHQKRFLHLDVSPKNLLASFASGAGCLADFGTAVRTNDGFIFPTRVCHKHKWHKVFYPTRFFADGRPSSPPGARSAAQAVYPFTPALDIFALTQSVRLMQLRICIGLVDASQDKVIVVPKRMGGMQVDKGAVLAEAFLREMYYEEMRDLLSPDETWASEGVEDYKEALDQFGEDNKRRVYCLYESHFGDFNSVHAHLREESRQLAMFLIQHQSDPKEVNERRLNSVYRTMLTMVNSLRPSPPRGKSSQCGFCHIVRGGADPLLGHGNLEWPGESDIKTLEQLGFVYRRSAPDAPAHFTSGDLHVMAPVDENGNDVLLISANEHIQDWLHLEQRHLPILERMREVALTLQPEFERDIHFKSSGSVPHLHLHVFRFGRPYIQKDNTVPIMAVMRMLGETGGISGDIARAAVRLPARLVSVTAQHGSPLSSAVLWHKDGQTRDVPGLINKHEPPRLHLPGGVRVNVLWALPDRGRAQVTLAVPARYIHRKRDGKSVESILNEPNGESLHPYDEAVLQDDGDRGIPNFYMTAANEFRRNPDFHTRALTEACLQSAIVHASTKESLAFIAFLVELQHLWELDPVSFSGAIKRNFPPLACARRQTRRVTWAPPDERCELHFSEPSDAEARSSDEYVLWNTTSHSRHLTMEVIEPGPEWTKIMAYEITTVTENFIALEPADRYLVQVEDGSNDIVLGRLTPRACYVRTAYLSRKERE